MVASRGRILLTALGLAMATVGYAVAQQNDQKAASDIKPAQAASPAAHPVETADTNNNDRRSSDSNTNDRSVERRTTERRAGDRNSDRDTGRTRERRDNNLNVQLAACLLNKNKGEVELGKIAADRANNQEVRDFAQKMVKDHGQQVKKLREVVGSNEPSDRRSKIAREIDERCLAALKKELNQKSGRDFDACYVGSQISGHMQMAAALEVVSEHASGQLRDIVKEAQPTVDKHLAEAKKLMEQLDRSGSRSQASKDRSETQR
jgi:putative membrane protein